MNTKVKKVLSGQARNYIFPFFWQHGETEPVLREYMQAIHACGIGAVCVESRPHPDFCGPKWWQDMDVILDEARKRGMKVWILDDSHFPTGYCNGALENGPDELRRQSVVCRKIGEAKAGEPLTLPPESYEKPAPFEKSRIEMYVMREVKTFDDDVLLGVVAVRKDGDKDTDLLMVSLTGDGLSFTPAEGEWELYACHLTRNRGPHRDYMNMMSRASCHKLIEAVYEPHYAHYAADFGKTIAGFFSDEPEIGNGHLYEIGLRTYETEDQPWSAEVEQALQTRWGADWVRYLPLLWQTSFDPDEAARVRGEYMDVVTRKVEEDFSCQLGDWCRAHGVQYIGHMIEDNNQHTRCGSSLGHYFRGLAGQDMAGIDDIGGQVFPQGEDNEEMSLLGSKRDGAFYHYALGKLAASAAAIDPRKKGRAMCEIFGNYGWAEGVQLEKYLADHFMVRGINHFVPHAFSAKEFPDPDCPPHFYAHGNNPQYRHFGALMGYMNRVCELISDGRPVSPVAVLYHAEADWMGGTAMYVQLPARVLTDTQINCDFIPADVFSEERYQTVIGKELRVNTQQYQALVIPECTYLSAATAKGIAALREQGFPVLFVNSTPQKVIGAGEEVPALEKALADCEIVPLDKLAERVRALGIGELRISPAEPLVRVLHYENGSAMYYFVNESDKTYTGSVEIAGQTGPCYAYNAWDNRLETANAKTDGDNTIVEICLEPRKSLLLFFDEAEGEVFAPLACKGEKICLDEGWTRSSCKAKKYPAFTGAAAVSLPDHFEEEQPDFGGFVRYEREIEINGDGPAVLEITDAAEGVEVFVNGVSAGIQIVPAYRYDISALVHKGKNRLAIEVATTLERVVFPPKRNPMQPDFVPQNRCGISGHVDLWLN